MMLTRELNEYEKAELKYKTKTQEKINNLYFDCKWQDIVSYFIGDGTTNKTPLYKICRHFYVSNSQKYPTLMYWSRDDYYQETLLNFWLTIQNQAHGDDFEFTRESSEDLYNTYYVEVDPLDFYSSIIAHARYILLEYVKNSKKDKTRINYSSCSLEQMQEVMGDNLQYLTLGEATWTPQFCEEQKTKGKRGRKKGSKNKKNRKE